MQEEPAPPAGDFSAMNVPPPPVHQSLPSIKKIGYFSKLLAYMCAVEMGDADRASKVKGALVISFTFVRMFEDHKNMMEETGEDHRFNYR